MARPKNGVNKSEEIRQVLRANPGIKAKEVVAALAAKGIDVADSQVYYVMGQLKGRRGRRRKAREAADKVAAPTVTMDPLATILRVKGLANEVGGIKKLKALIEALGA